MSRPDSTGARDAGAQRGELEGDRKDCGLHMHACQLKVGVCGTVPWLEQASEAKGAIALACIPAGELSPEFILTTSAAECIGAALVAQQPWPGSLPGGADLLGSIIQHSAQVQQQRL